MAKHLEIVLYAEDGWNDGKIESVVQTDSSKSRIITCI